METVFYKHVGKSGKKRNLEDASNDFETASKKLFYTPTLLNFSPAFKSLLQTVKKIWIAIFASS